MKAERWRVAAGGGVIALAIAAAYANTLSAPFIFDDISSIVENPNIRHPWTMANLLPPAGGEGQAGRPVTSLSLAFNYACGGLDVRGYHAVNVAIHILAALTLFGIVRRMLVGSHRPTVVAFVVALVWAVHPLLTESVTCVIQRNESMMGLFYLLTLYCFIRYSEVARDLRARDGWAIGSILACLLGMATKETMVTAPVVVLLFDRTFVAGTWAVAWRRRSKYHLGLAATWLALAGILVHQGGSRGTAAGFGLGITPWTYALTQCRAIVHYLRLAVWPRPLVLDYGKEVVTRFGAVAPQAVALIALAAAAAWALFRKEERHDFQPLGGRALGFAGAWFFIILAPSSSVVPLVTQTVAEHRMYLPLAGIVAASVLAAEARWGRRALAGFLVLAVVFGGMTVRRNWDYRSSFAIWSATLAARPENARAYNNVGLALLDAGRPRDAIAPLQRSLALDPNYGDAENDLGLAEERVGRQGDAAAHYERAIRLGQSPSCYRARNNLGVIYARTGHPQAAIEQYRKALALFPEFAEVENNYGLVLVDTGRAAEAIAHYERALALAPRSAEIETNYGLALLDSGRKEEGKARLGEALTMGSDQPEVRRSFARGYLGVGEARAKAGKLPDAIMLLRLAVRAAPDSVEARSELGDLLGRAGRLGEALQAYEEAARLAPDNAATHYNLGNVLRAVGRPDEAIRQYEEAIRLSPSFAEAENNLGISLAATNHMKEAAVHFEAALRLKAGYTEARENLAKVRSALDLTARPR